MCVTDINSVLLPAFLYYLYVKSARTQYKKMRNRTKTGLLGASAYKSRRKRVAFC